MLRNGSLETFRPKDESFPLSLRRTQQKSRGVATPSGCYPFSAISVSLYFFCQELLFSFDTSYAHRPVSAAKIEESHGAKPRLSTSCPSKPNNQWQLLLTFFLNTNSKKLLVALFLGLLTPYGRVALRSLEYIWMSIIESVTSLASCDWESYSTSFVYIVTVRIYLYSRYIHMYIHTFIQELFCRASFSDTVIYQWSYSTDA